MNRTQIYITQAEQASLSELSRKTGKTKSELIREAIDRYIDGFEDPDWKQALQASAGIWRNKRILPDVRQLRSEMDRP